MKDDGLMSTNSLDADCDNSFERLANYYMHRVVQLAGKSPSLLTVETLHRGKPSLQL